MNTTLQVYTLSLIINTVYLSNKKIALATTMDDCLKLNIN